MHGARTQVEDARAGMLHAITRVAEGATGPVTPNAEQQITAIGCGGASMGGGAGVSSVMGALRDATVEFARAHRGLRSAADVYDAAA
jgi:hypothetical protein